MLRPPPPARQAERLAGAALTLEQFYARYERLPGMPVIFTDLTDTWSSCPRHAPVGRAAAAGGRDNGDDSGGITDDNQHDDDDSNKNNNKATDANQGGLWTMGNFLRRFSGDWFRFDDLHGEEIQFEAYYAYCMVTRDDSPLAIYDSQFGEPFEPDPPGSDADSEPDDEFKEDGEDEEDEEESRNALISEYTVPRFFAADMFSIVCRTDIDSVPTPPSDNDNRPPFRWVLIGPARSGTGLHIDPLWTSAWVTLLHGQKRWFMFPPDTDHARVAFAEHGPTKMEAVEWFDRFFGTDAANGVEGCIEILQRPGETVFVPAGWLHIVVNLTTTLSITHNYASPHGGRRGVQKIWGEIVAHEPAFARRWFRRLVGLPGEEEEDGADGAGEDGEDGKATAEAVVGGVPEWATANDVEVHIREEHARLRKEGLADWDLPPPLPPTGP